MGVGESSKRERICVYTELIHFAGEQKEQHCKAIILQKKIYISK